MLSITLISLLWISSYLTLIVSYNTHNTHISTIQTTLCPSHYDASITHEQTNPEKRHLHLIGCTSYTYADHVHTYTSLFIHYYPIFSSWEQQKVCYIFEIYDTPDVIDKLHEMDDEFTFTLVSSVLKLDDTVESLLMNDNDESSTLVLEIALGLGVQGKGIPFNHTEVGQDILFRAQQIYGDRDLQSSHWESFYWTSEVPLSVKSAQTPPSVLHEKRRRFLQSTNSYCDFSTVEVQHGSRSHVHLTSRVSNMNSIHSDDNVPAYPKRARGGNKDCMLFLASVAVMTHGVSHVSVHEGLHMNTESVDTTLANATDQNAWIQSGDHTDTPYTDIGLDGKGYVLGMIDSGVDDLSCYFIDDTHERTTRTHRSNYANPITEPHRRKIIQYVAFADGIPDETFDHGTWCSGASVGKCINPKDHHRPPYRSAEQFNGLITEAKLAMFDVQAKGHMYVPSLYSVGFPPAYAAGARVHSNSWGCRGIASYTSYALDIDEYMYEHPDFLVVVAAGNDGAAGMDSVMSPGVSKSALTIGASAENHNEIVSFSGIGQEFRGMIKPDVIGPGSNLMSAGVGTGEKESCNVQLSSGTSMATPIVAASAIIVKQYLEHTSYWGSLCNTTYRSCPHVASKGKDGKRHASGTLLKAILVHSATDMNKLLAEAGSTLPTTNLTEPPDRFQGWGQVMLKNALPLPGYFDYDLYIADYESLESLTRRTYKATVLHTSQALRVSVVWNDPPNVVWAAKMLLNDIDLMVISPSGQVFYGNNRRGDEFNPLERVVIHKPEKGVYTVHVTAKKLAMGSEQLYSIVITSKGYVDESATAVARISAEDLNYDDNTRACMMQGGSLIRLQLEDWKAGLSWRDMYFTLSKMEGSQVGETVFIRTFTSNHDKKDALTNRVDRFSACLQPKTNYIARINNLAAMSGEVLPDNSKYIRVVSPGCKMSLSSYWRSQTLHISGDGECNRCDNGFSPLRVVMRANVTDDDYAEYTWYGDAHYEVWTSKLSGKPKTLMAASTLVLSDEEADVLCLPNGEYDIVLHDKQLFRNHNKHANILVSGPNSEGRQFHFEMTHHGRKTITLGESHSGNWPYIWYLVIIAVVVVLAIATAFFVRRRASGYSQIPTADSGTVFSGRQVEMAHP